MITLKVFLSVFCLWTVVSAYGASYDTYDSAPVYLRFIFLCLSGALATSFVFFIFDMVWFT